MAWAGLTTSPWSAARVSTMPLIGRANFGVAESRTSGLLALRLGGFEHRGAGFQRGAARRQFVPSWPCAMATAASAAFTCLFSDSTRALSAAASGAGLIVSLVRIHPALEKALLAFESQIGVFQVRLGLHHLRPGRGQVGFGLADLVGRLRLLEFQVRLGLGDQRAGLRFCALA